MFDAVSWIREKIFRRPKISPVFAGEEVTEKQTTKMWYFLLACMFVAILTSAQWTLDIIRDIPTPPTQVPGCISRVVNKFIPTDSTSNYSKYNNYDYWYYNEYDSNTCVLTAGNPRFDFTTEYKELSMVYDAIIVKEKSLSDLETQKTQLTNNQNNNQNDYNTSLSEKIANEENQIYDRAQVKETIWNTRRQIASLTTQISTLQANIDSTKNQYMPQARILREKLAQADNDYRAVYILYRLYIALLSFAFSLIVFLLLYHFYMKQKLRNSPHTMIFSVATFAYGLILLQVAGVFLWDIIPHTILEALMRFIGNFTALLYIVQFLWPLVIVASFGYFVYRIQKRLYSPSNILKRFVADKKCPHCGNGVDITKPFCPLCAHEIQIHCPTCQELTLKGMPYCAHCGSNLSLVEKI